MKFGSVCSGIEAASVAWHPLGWKASWLSEIEPFPSAVLTHHYPDVPNLGDMTKLPEMVLSEQIHAPDVLVGGTPCQAFSVAGLRGGLSDERGQLTIKFVELANAIDTIRSRRNEQPSIVVWENVPGVLSSKDNAFGCFLAALSGAECELQPAGQRWANAGIVIGEQRSIAWRILDAQYFGVAQRRRRVFVVASARAGFDPAEVLFERQSVPGDNSQSQSAGQGATSAVADSVGALCARTGQSISVQDASQGHLIATHPPEIANTLTARMHKGVNSSLDEGQSLVYPLAFPANLSGTQAASSVNISPSLGAKNPTAVATQSVSGVICKESFTGGMGGRPEGAAAGHLVIAIAENTIGRADHAGGNGNGYTVGGPMYTLNCAGVHGVSVSTQVRRLTPTECERLQGFPDGYTAIPWRGKPAELCPDGPRYKALGNSMAVPVMRWIGERLTGQTS